MDISTKNRKIIEYLIDGIKNEICAEKVTKVLLSKGLIVRELSGHIEIFL